MKQQRVRLMKQLKAESEQFRRTKATMAREMLQLKSQVGIALSYIIECVYITQGDHLSGKPGNVREFETCQGKNLVVEKCPKTVHY